MGIKKIANCKHCKDRSICVKPCQALLDDLQRHIPPNKNELYIGIPTYSKKDWPSAESMKHLQRMEKVILTLELFGFSRKVISELFGIKRDSVRKYIYSARKKILRNS